MDTYLESAIGVDISKARAILELKRHGIVDIDQFYIDLGCKDVYSAKDVLYWLGY